MVEGNCSAKNHHIFKRQGVLAKITTIFHVEKAKKKVSGIFKIRIAAYSLPLTSIPGF